jgi:hypothetical protein
MKPGGKEAAGWKPLMPNLELAESRDLFRPIKNRLSAIRC